MPNDLDSKPSVVSEAPPAIHADKKRREEIPRQEPTRVSDTRKGFRDRIRGARRLIVILVLIGAVGGGVGYWWLNRGLVSTDDAFIDGDAVTLSPQVGGRIERLRISDNQRVKTGDLLLEIDPSDFLAARASAQASLDGALSAEAEARSNLELTKASTAATIAEAKSGLALAKAGVGQSEAQHAAASAETQRAAADAKRYMALSKNDYASRQTLDQAQATARVAAAQELADIQAVAVAEAKVGQAEAQIAQAETATHQIAVKEAQLQSASASVEAARAALRTAELNLSYTKIYAPQDGYITRRQVNAGDVIQKNQTLATLVFGMPWVTANFKETQLDGMRPGQPVEIALDAYPAGSFKGRVDSIMRGTGSRFSLLPPEDATGNYVKVVQRVPVKIVFEGPIDAAHVLSLGMSVVPTVDTRAATAAGKN
jgi:membrane fusion protein (multidrug efflux system)